MRVFVSFAHVDEVRVAALAVTKDLGETGTGVLEVMNGSREDDQRP